MNGFTVRLAAYAMAVCAVALFPACSEDNDGPKGNPREDIPLSRSEEELVEANNEFAYKFMSEMNNWDETPDNFVVSPLNLSIALSMTANGAAGETREAMLNALGFDGDDLEGLNELNKKLIGKLPALDNRTKVALANSVWANGRFASDLREDFANKVLEAYGAPFSFVDKMGSENTRRMINTWGSENTNGLVPEVLKEPLSDDTMIAIANALYFKGCWSADFKKENTKEDTFHNYDGSSSRVRMMNEALLADCFSEETYSAVSIPYGNGAFSMMIVLPHIGQDLDEVIGGINPKVMEDLGRGKLYSEHIGLKLPKFDIEFNRDLLPLLDKMGLFVGSDFSAMWKTAAMQISGVIQGAKIIVDEEGTEAAAVTVVTGDLMSPGPIMGKDFFVDRPFAFIIAERSTGLPLFMGRVTKL